MNKKLIPLFLVMGIALACIFAGYFLIKGNQRLPVYQPSDVNPDLVPESMQRKSRGHRISEFALIDQDGRPFTQKDIEGKIVVADFFFVTCPSICPKMAVEMKKIRDEFSKGEVLLLSHTVMPEHDSVPVLKKYADSLGVDDQHWRFLTGPKEEIYRLARRSYMVTKSEGQGDTHDFIHTENLVLVDSMGRIRGYYDGTSPEDTQKAIDDIYLLLKEQNNS